MAPDSENFQNIIDFPKHRNHVHDVVFPGSSRVKRPLNSRIEDCRAGGMGDDPYPETEDVHSSGIEDYEPMRMVSLHLCSSVQTNLRKTKLGWRKTKRSQKWGIRLTIFVMLRLTQAFRS